MASLAASCPESCPASFDGLDIMLQSTDLRHLIIEPARKIGITLKDKQLEAIQRFCSGKDTFVSLPTDYGKSLIYGILPLVYNTLKGGMDIRMSYCNIMQLCSYRYS